MRPKKVSLFKAKGGFLEDLQGLAGGLIASGMIIGVGSLVLAEFLTDVQNTDPSFDGENATNATQAITDSQEGISNVTSRFPIIATVAVMGVLLVLVGRFAFGNK